MGGEVREVKENERVYRAATGYSLQPCVVVADNFAMLLLLAAVVHAIHLVPAHPSNTQTKAHYRTRGMIYTYITMAYADVTTAIQQTPTQYELNTHSASFRTAKSPLGSVYFRSYLGTDPNPER